MIDKTADGQTRLFQLADVEVLDQQSAYDGFYQIQTLQLRHKLFAGGWSESIRRELFVRHEAVGVLLYDPQRDAVALIEQFRVGALGHLQQQQYDGSPWMLELVAGLIDKNETVKEVACREAEEEAGVTVQQLEPIHNYYSSPGGSNEFCYLFCGCVDLETAGGIHGLEEEGEDIRVHVFSVEQCRQMLEQGELINAHTVIAVQWLLLHHHQLQQRWLGVEY
jgi:ADP-ribose pyrophosphatase